MSPGEWSLFFVALIFITRLCWNPFNPHPQAREVHRATNNRRVHAIGELILMMKEESFLLKFKKQANHSGELEKWARENNEEGPMLINDKTIQLCQICETRGISHKLIECGHHVFCRECIILMMRERKTTLLSVLSIELKFKQRLIMSKQQQGDDENQKILKTEKEHINLTSYIVHD